MSFLPALIVMHSLALVTWPPRLVHG